MKTLKLLTAAMALFPFVTFAQEDAIPEAEMSSDAIESAEIADSPKSADRSYLPDYADKKAAIFLVDSINNRTVNLNLKEVKSREYVFINPEGGELVVPKNSTAFKFDIRKDRNLERAERAYATENWEAVLANMRPVVYPLTQLTSMPESVFKVGDYMGMFITALINADKPIELSTFILSLPLSEVSAALGTSALEAANALAKAGMKTEAFSIIDRVRLTGDHLECIPAALVVLDTLRKSGELRDCLVRYVKISSIPNNPQKDIAQLWMIFCDLGLGNKAAADVYLSALSLDRNTAEFSLQQMLKGMMREIGETPDYHGALDLYSEGIVYGLGTSDWMPELMFKMGLAYKKIGNNIAANEIFRQIASFYPTDAVAARAEKEIVEQKADADSSGGHDEEYDEYDE